MGFFLLERHFNFHCVMLFRPKCNDRRRDSRSLKKSFAVIQSLVLLDFQVDCLYNYKGNAAMYVRRGLW